MVHWDFAGGIAKSDHTKKTRKIPPMCPLELREATRRVWCFSFGTSRLILVHQPYGVFKNVPSIIIFMASSHIAVMRNALI